MDFKDEIKQLADRVAKMKEKILTEEATKNAFIMPFINCLGYDVFNPLEVVLKLVSLHAVNASAVKKINTGNCNFFIRSLSGFYIRQLLFILCILACSRL